MGQDTDTVHAEAKKSGNGAHIYVPREWEGDKVKAVRLDSENGGDEQPFQQMPAFSTDRTRGGHPAIKCPNCGGDHMHQSVVDIFVRCGEDAKQGQHIHVDYREGTQVKEDVSTEAGNPSSRRDGIVIKFSCELCSATEPKYELVIQQHKGNEFVGWRIVDVNEIAGA